MNPQGRILERIQGGKDASQGWWPLRFTYVYDHDGNRLAEVVRDARGELVKETRAVYDARGNRSAELAAWGDGTFENVSLYVYDDSHRLRRGLHYNAVQVVNRNLYAYDAAGRLVQERFERNYRYDAAGHQVVTSDRFDVGHDVTIIYEAHYVHYTNRPPYIWQSINNVSTGGWKTLQNPFHIKHRN